MINSHLFINSWYNFIFSLKVSDISGDRWSSICNTNFNHCPYLNLSQCLHKLGPKICELWAALVQLHDSQFPGQVRKADMNKPLCVFFFSGKNLGGGGGGVRGRVRLESLWTPAWSRTLVWVKVSLGDDVIYTSMSVSPVIIVPQGLFC